MFKTMSYEMSNSEHARDKFRSKTSQHAASRLFPCKECER